MRIVAFEWSFRSAPRGFLRAFSAFHVLGRRSPGPRGRGPLGCPGRSHRRSSRALHVARIREACQWGNPFGLACTAELLIGVDRIRKPWHPIPGTRRRPVHPDMGSRRSRPTCRSSAPSARLVSTRLPTGGDRPSTSRSQSESGGPKPHAERTPTPLSPPDVGPTRSSPCLNPASGPEPPPPRGGPGTGPKPLAASAAGAPRFRGGSGPGRASAPGSVPGPVRA